MVATLLAVTMYSSLNQSWYLFRLGGCKKRIQQLVELAECLEEARVQSVGDLHFCHCSFILKPGNYLFNAQYSCRNGTGARGQALNGYNSLHMFQPFIPCRFSIQYSVRLKDGYLTCLPKIQFRPMSDQEGIPGCLVRFICRWTGVVCEEVHSRCLQPPAQKHC